MADGRTASGREIPARSDRRRRDGPLGAAPFTDAAKVRQDGVATPQEWCARGLELGVRRQDLDHLGEPTGIPIRVPTGDPVADALSGHQFPQLHNEPPALARRLAPRSKNMLLIAENMFSERSPAADGAGALRRVRPLPELLPATRW